MGCLPLQIKAKKRSLGSPNKIPDYKTAGLPALSNAIPANGTKSPDISKTKHKFTVAPICNKGAYSVVNKEDLKYVGKKL